MDLYKFLEKLVSIPTVSGFESDNINKAAETCLEGANFFDGYTVLPSGSILFERKCGKENAKKIVFDAHIDTIGFAVSEIIDGGFVKVTNIGGVDPYILPSTPVMLYGKSDIRGFFTSVPPHLAAKENKEKLKVDDLYVDTGIDEGAEDFVSVGTPVGFCADMQRLENNIAVSHSFDDKACVAAAVAAFEKLSCDKEVLTCDVALHLSVGEEKTALGAKTLPYALIDADACIVLDVNFAYTSGIEKYESLIMGKGAGVSYSSTTSRKLTDFISDTAKKNGIPVQSVVEMRSTGTNATHIHRNGIPCAVLSVPLKNMHTYCESVCLDDIENCSEILAACVREFSEFPELYKTIK